MFENLLGRWLNTAEEMPVPILEQEPRMLHGVNLNDWTFLGISKLIYTTIPPLGTESSEYASVFHFINRANSNDRKLVIPQQLSNTVTDFTQHEWYVITGSLWLAAEIPIYHGINLYVTDYLKNYMAQFHNMEWNLREFKWQPIINDVFAGVNEVPAEPPNNNVRIIKPGQAIVHKSEPDANGVSKVITVNFGKKKDIADGDNPGPVLA